MDWVVTLIIVGFIAFLVYLQQQSNRKKNPIGPLVSRAATCWNGAPPDIRDFMLNSCGVPISGRAALMQATWFALPVQVQTDLLRLQMTSEFSVANDPSLGGLGPEPKRDRDATVSNKSTVAPATARANVAMPQATTYFNAFFLLAMNLSRSVPLKEWATGTPQDYNVLESISIEQAKDTMAKLPFTSKSRYVLEPLEKLVAEIGLINAARELRELSGQNWENEFLIEDEEWGTDVPVEELEDMVSTYLKAWLCNSNPFVLIELAYLLIQVGRFAEAKEAIEVAQKFPSYARTRTLSEMEMVAQSLAYDLLPLGPGREARSFGKGLYSPETLALLSAEVKKFQSRMDEQKGNRAEVNRAVLKESCAVATATPIPIPTTPSDDQIKGAWQAWKNDSLLEFFEERDKEMQRARKER